MENKSNLHVFSKPETSVFPNPFKQSAQLSFFLSESGDTDLRIFDTSGNLVFNQSYSFPSGLNQIEFGDALSAGMYFYDMTSAENRFKGRLVKIN